MRVWQDTQSDWRGGRHTVTRYRAALNRAIHCWACGLVFVLLGFGMTPTVAYSSNVDTPLVRLSSGTAPPEFCRAMTQAIVKLSGGRFDMCLVDAGDTTPRNAADIGVSVTIDGRGQNWIAAHLGWRIGPDGTPAQGPSMEFSVMDADISQEMYDKYAENIIRADNEMSKSLMHDHKTEID